MFLFPLKNLACKRLIDLSARISVWEVRGVECSLLPAICILNNGQHSGVVFRWQVIFLPLLSLCCWILCYYPQNTGCGQSFIVGLHISGAFHFALLFFFPSGHLQGKDQALYSSEFSQSLDFVKKASADCERSSVIGQCMAMAAPVGTSEEDLEPDTLPDINTACKPAAQGKAARARGLHSARAKPGKAGPAKARVTDTQSCRRRQMATKTAVARTANKPSAEPPEKNRPGDRGQPMGGKMGPVSSRTKPLLSSAWPPGRGCSSEMSGVHPLKTRPSGRKLDIKPGTGKRSLSAERSLSVGSCVKCLRPHATQCNPCSQVSAGPRRRSASGGYVLPVQQWTLQKGSCGQAIKTATQTVQPALSWASVGDGRPPASGCQNYPGNVGVVGSSHEDLVVQPQKPGAIHSSQSPEDQPTTTTPSEAATSTVPYPLELADLSAGDVSLPDIRQPRHSQLRSRKRRKKTCGPQEQRKRKRASKKAVNLSACGVDMASQRPELSAIYGGKLVASQLITHKHLETHGCRSSTVATDDLMLKHQAISTHNAE